ncbi:MAG TPA: hypothetical protein VFJ93_00350 [Gaiellaceae bacterium]|nr:hypothetical protein [Gaiellaceae bacterium]
MRRTLALVLAGVPLLGGAPAAASSGVAIDVARIAISEQLAPGGSYRLPSFGIRNAGTTRTSYRLVVSYLETKERRPPAGWFRLSPGSITLAPGQSHAIGLRLVLPPTAHAGRYEALVGPQIVTGTHGAQVGAGAAARLTFTVEQSPWWESVWRWFTRLLAGLRPWTFALAGSGALAAAAVRLRRRFAITITRRAG